MELEPGRYHIEVSASDHETGKQWHELEAGEDRRISIRLEPSAPKGPQAGDMWRDTETGLEFVWVPGGCFMMGQTEDEKAYLIKEVGDEKYKEYFERELPRHSVCVDGFWMGKTEVTVGAFRRFVKDTGYRTEAEQGGGAYAWSDGKWQIKEGVIWKEPGFIQSDEHPVTCVSFNDAKGFIEWLERKSGRSMRLPTEAEWEYAARAGTTGMRFWGTDDSQACTYANVADQTSKRRYGWRYYFDCEDGGAETSPVGRFSPNSFGLHDMLGNVWEWCEDWYGPYSSAEVRNPTGLSSGSQRVMRGGSWDINPVSVRSAFRRVGGTPDSRGTYLGFRLLRTE